MASQLVLAGASRQLDESEQNIFACFIPDEDCVDTIIKWIGYAHKEIMVEAYSFSCKRIADALIDAKKRGISVSILIDKDAGKKRGNLIETLISQEIEIKVDEQSGKAHNKVMIIDKGYVITGSYNFTDVDYDHNSDVVVFIRDECVNEKYRVNHDYNLQMNELMHLQQPNILSQAVAPWLYKVGCCTVSLTNSADMSHDDGFTRVSSKSQKKKERSENFVDVDVCFTGLNQDCTQKIVKCIDNAKSRIYMQACSLTHKDISDALIHAHRREVRVTLLVDKKAFDDGGDKVRTLVEVGILVVCDPTCPGIAHSKTIIIDNDLVLTGSFNFTYSAQKHNQENLLQIRNVHVNNMFCSNFYRKWNQAREVKIKAHCFDPFAYAKMCPTYFI